MQAEEAAFDELVMSKDKGISEEKKENEASKQPNQRWWLTRYQAHFPNRFTLISRAMNFNSIARLYAALLKLPASTDCNFLYVA